MCHTAEVFWSRRRSGSSCCGSVSWWRRLSVSSSFRLSQWTKVIQCQLFLWFMVEVAMAPATAMKVHDFDYFQCVLVGRVSGWHARVEVEEEACNARTGGDSCQHEPSASFFQHCWSAILADAPALDRSVADLLKNPVATCGYRFFCFSQFLRGPDFFASPKQMPKVSAEPRRILARAEVKQKILHHQTLTRSRHSKDIDGPTALFLTLCVVVFAVLCCWLIPSTSETSARWKVSVMILIWLLLRGTLCLQRNEVLGNNRSAIPLEYQGCTRITLMHSTSLSFCLKRLASLQCASWCRYSVWRWQNYLLIAPHHFGVREFFASKTNRNRRAQNYFCNTFGRNGKALLFAFPPLEVPVFCCEQHRNAKWRTEFRKLFLLPGRIVVWSCTCDLPWPEGSYYFRSFVVSLCEQRSGPTKLSPIYTCVPKSVRFGVTPRVFQRRRS